MFKNFTLASILSIIIIGLFVGVVFVYATPWTPPVSSPPDCPSGDPGCDAPINVSSSLQNKTGSLGINGFIDVLSDSFFRSNVNVTGNVDVDGIILTGAQQVYSGIGGSVMYIKDIGTCPDGWNQFDNNYDLFGNIAERVDICYREDMQCQVFYMEYQLTCPVGWNQQDINGNIFGGRRIDACYKCY